MTRLRPTELSFLLSFFLWAFGVLPALCSQVDPVTVGQTVRVAPPRLTEGMEFNDVSLCDTLSLRQAPVQSTLFADSLPVVKHAPRWFRQWLSSLIRGNVDHTRDKPLDLSFAVSPSYTREASFGIGGAATALYRMNRNDTLKSPSDVFASVNISINGFFVVTFKGNNLFPDNRSRLSYNLELYRKSLDFWGVNSEETARNPTSHYDRRQIDLKAEYVYRIYRNIYLGAQMRLDYTEARTIRNPEYLLGERPRYYVTGLGASVALDSRDNILNPTRGVYLMYKALFYPHWLGNAPHYFMSQHLICDAYIGLWKGAVLGLDYYFGVNTDKTPWTMREQIASDGIRMRGYYMGEAIDNSQIAAQIELRQHVYKRFGVVGWVGGATLFSSIKDYTTKNIRPEWLHNFGLGLRFEFKHNVNARVDFGWGQGTKGLVFAIGEAF